MLTDQKTVLVTGGTGYVAAHIINLLLTETDYLVRTTVRDKSKTKKYQFLLDFKNPRLSIHEANLLDPEPWSELVNGCYCVFHVASPYALGVKNPVKDLLDPALMGTQHVIDAACAKNVKHVILTSSIAAICDQPDPNHVFSELDWNTKSSLDRNPYYYSKTQAEKLAWELVNEYKGEKPRLVTINPFIILGPSFTSAVNTSASFLLDIVSWKSPFIPNLSWGIVDVRDTARAHLIALENTSLQGRFLICNDVWSLPKVFESLKKKFTNYRFPYLYPSDFITRIGAIFRPSDVYCYLQCNLGYGPYKIDNSKSIKTMGLKYRPIEETLSDTFNDFIKWNHI
jgi:dihydroflavonol-4-reductase